MELFNIKEKIKRVNGRHLATDLILTAVTFYLSLFLRVNPDDARIYLPDMLRILPLVIVARCFFFVAFETYNIIWRYVSAVDAVRLANAILSSTLIIISGTYILQLGVLPRSVYFIDSLLLLSVLTGIRLSRRLLHEHQSAVMLKKMGQKTLIYGAGATGQGVLKRLQVDKELKLHVMAFVDDDKLKIGKAIAGLRVFSGNEILNVIKNYEIKNVVVGIPNPSKDFLKTLVAELAPTGIKPLLMMKSAAGDEANLREVELKDLLVRPPHEIDVTSTKEMIFGKRVLVTGAGGSIGSEIVKQVLSLDPARLVILDHSEFNLYKVDQMLRGLENYDEKIVPALVDICNSSCLRDIFEKYRPELVIHAAAYKHVHLVESNPYSAILNNIAGTRNLLNLCEEFNVEKFVQVSTDKAVNPAGVMGATKRVCEIMTSIAAQKTGTVYCSVRFGNVLGSSGSLIPLLMGQIEKNQALTITHKDITRYFMLIEEAVSLVLKAGSISKPGDINVLKMGEPVKIIDIAETLVRLMGKSLDEVEFRFTGLRPGEKMFEELYISGKELNTEHPDILVMPKGDALPENFTTDEFSQCIDSIIKYANESDKKAIVHLSSLINSQYFSSIRLVENDKSSESKN